MKESSKNHSFNQRIIQSVHHFDVPSAVEKETALESLLSKTEKRNETKPVQRINYRLTGVVSVAASLLIGMVLWITLATTGASNNGKQVAAFRLPDQSRIVLDRNGSVSFRKFFFDRKIKLEGKAYFEVTKGSRFRVVTGNGTVQVLGTRFIAGSTSSGMEVFCYEGKVKATFRGTERPLPGGSGVRFSDSGEVVQLTGTESYPEIALFTGEYHHADAALVLSDLEAFFGIRIINQIERQRYFSGTICTGDHDIALRILTASLQLEYEHLKNNIIRIYHQQ